MNALSKEIIKEWNLGTLSENKRTDVVNRISHVLFQAVLVRSLDILSDDEQTELDEMMDQDATTPEDVLLFLKSKIPTFNSLLREERVNLRNEIFV